MGDVVKHISKDDLCPFCKKTKATFILSIPMLMFYRIRKADSV
jgi:hypothetical protein